MINDSLKVTGEVNIKLYDAKGVLKKEVDRSNLVVTMGKSFIASRIANNLSVPMNHMALGYGDVPANINNTSLEDEALNGRISIAQPIVVNNVLTFTGVFGPSYGTGTIKEAGIFNSNSGGVMLCRTTFPEVVKEDDDTIAVSWSVTIS